MLFFFPLLAVVVIDSFHSIFLSRIQSAASSLQSLASHIGIYGVLGFQEGKNIGFSESGWKRKMAFLGTYSVEYLLDLLYRTLLLLLESCWKKKSLSELVFFPFNENHTHGTRKKKKKTREWRNNASDFVEQCVLNPTPSFLSVAAEIVSIKSGRGGRRRLWLRLMTKFFDQWREKLIFWQLNTTRMLLVSYPAYNPAEGWMI